MSCVTYTAAVLARCDRGKQVSLVAVTTRPEKFLEKFLRVNNLRIASHERRQRECSFTITEAAVTLRKNNIIAILALNPTQNLPQTLILTVVLT